MANMVRRESREPARQDGNEYRWDPFRVMDALLRWDPLHSENNLLSRGGEYVPRFDVKEAKNSYVLRADLPGVKEEDVEVSVNGSLLTVAGKREDERRDEGEQYYSVERSYGTFSRSFSLPDGIDAAGISADLKSGVLTVQIPKRPEAQPRKISLGKNAGSTNDTGTAKA
jgi:HSP20 family protein